MDPQSLTREAANAVAGLLLVCKFRGEAGISHTECPRLEDNIGTYRGV